MVVKCLPHARGEGERVLALESQEGTRASRRVDPLQYSCLENSMDRGACQATVHGVAMSQTRLSDDVPSY